jgi:hypothetical protein
MIADFRKSFTNKPDSVPLGCAKKFGHNLCLGPSSGNPHPQQHPEFDFLNRLRYNVTIGKQRR